MNTGNKMGFMPSKTEEDEQKEVKISPYEQSLLDCFTEMVSTKYRPSESIKTATLLLSTQEIIDRMGKGKPMEVHAILVSCGFLQYSSGHALLWLLENK